ncbi:MAG: glycosyltransferase family 39 protein [Anaerolineaceae bacterium]|nr:glycosyltransferase family 39 protein [Anaerolineaceae bacterium]
MMEEEQSVLDYVVSMIKWIANPRRFPRPQFPPDDLPGEPEKANLIPFEEIQPPAGVLLSEQKAPPSTVLPEQPPLFVATTEESEEERERPRIFSTGMIPWRALLALLLAIWAQMLLEPPDRSPKTAIVLYIAAGLFLTWAVFAKEWVLPPHRKDSDLAMSTTVRRYFGWLMLIVVVVLMIFFGGNQINPVNLFLWAASLFYVIRATWVRAEKKEKNGRRLGVADFFKNRPIFLKITGWQILVFAVVLIALFFRFYRLGGVPGEMFSDHAEKLLDVGDILNGLTPIFFPRNTGREALQMYLTAGIALLFHTGLSFISLKLGTALAGFLTLPYIYKLGKEVGNRWVGLLAFLMAGMAYWPNLFSRIGLRFPLYPLFVAPLLFYMVRGLRTSNRNDMILAGIALGLGLHGYSPMRIVPLVTLVLVGLYLLHAQARGKRVGILAGVIVLAITAFIVFLPLLRYMLDDPQMFGYRAFSRLGTTERAFPGPVWQIFLSNLWKAMIMFFWDNGGIWVHSVVGRPALDVIMAALLFLGMLLLLIRYVRQRNWVDLWLLVSIPLLMLPSILSLAFPDENPSLNRTGGAIVPVFVIAALALESLLAGFWVRAKGMAGKALPVLIGIGLLAGSAAQNYNLVFKQFDRQFMAGAWNTSEIGHIIRAFSESVGSPQSAYVVPFPYWVDTRLVGISAGYPFTDYALWPENFPLTLSEKQAKLFILKAEDQESLQKLKELYPEGVSWIRYAEREGKDLTLFFVPMQPDADGRNVEP